MIHLMREVRFYSAPVCTTAARPESNHWAGTEPQSGPPFWLVRVLVEGPVDARTGYVCDIKILDDLVREHLYPGLSAGSPRGSFGAAALTMVNAYGLLAGKLTGPLRLVSIQLRFSPFTFFTVHGGDPLMNALTQSFEFSASHRLFCRGLSDEENHRLYGKCSNPHGHNYVLEVTVEVRPEAIGSNLQELDRAVRSVVIERFDHKNLNMECAEFAELNPTVENIAQVIFDRLGSALKPLGLRSVRVWETAKTYAECSTSNGPAPHGHGQ